MVWFCRRVAIASALVGTLLVPAIVNAQVFTDPTTGERVSPPAVRVDGSGVADGLPLVYGDVASVHGMNLRLKSGLNVVLTPQTVMDAYGPSLRPGRRIAMRGYYHEDQATRQASFYARSIVVISARNP